ncbi:MAG: sigma-54 factor interaction domain-containing protein, partial [bacterium]|nr:sigma-54 factor interaction domain-containing protein [bacterium]
MELHEESFAGAAPGDGVLAALASTSRAQAILLVLAPDPRAVSWPRALHPEGLGVPVFAVCAGGNPSELQELLDLGFTDLLLAPLTAGDVLPRLWRSLEHLRPQPSGTHGVRQQLGLCQLVGESPLFLEQVEKIPLIARCDAGVLIRGETGTGKELVARAIHYLSPRSKKPFVPVNCGAIPVDLVENEFFGHERSAYTGASSAQSGLIEEADGGTLFLGSGNAQRHHEGK